MIYSINNCMVFYNSGIEHAEIQRLKLFHHFNHPMKILFDDWNPQHSLYLKENNLKSTDAINMYDYYQHAVTARFKSFTIHDLGVAKGHQIMHFPNYDVIKHKTGYVYCISFYKKPYNLQVRRMDCYYHKQCLYSFIYDIRGFATQCILWAKNGYEKKIGFLTPNGKVAFTATFGTLPQQNTSTKIYEIYHLPSHKKPIYSISNLIMVFLNDICYRANKISGHPTIFIDDRWWRSENIDDILENIHYPHYSAYYMHYAQNLGQRNITELNFNRIVKQANVLDPYHSFNALICSTKSQSRDIRNKYHLKRPVFTIPVGIQNQMGISKYLPMGQRRQYRIVCATRISKVEGIGDTIKAFCLAKRDIPQLTLDIYGKMGPLSSDLMSLIYHMKQKYLLGHSLKIHSYVPEKQIAQLYRHAQLTLATAPSDAFNISLLQALSQGCPAIVYRKDYGPRALVKNKANGYTTRDHPQDVADKIVTYFKYPALMQRMSDNAYNMSKKYSPKNIWALWKRFLLHVRQALSD